MSDDPFRSPDAFWRRAAWTAALAVLVGTVIACGVIMAAPHPAGGTPRHDHIEPTGPAMAGGTLEFTYAAKTPKPLTILVVCEQPGIVFLERQPAVGHSFTLIDPRWNPAVPATCSAELIHRVRGGEDVDARVEFTAAAV